MGQDNDSTCRLCGQEFKSAIVMKNHIVKSTDCKHQLLAYIYEQLHIKCKDLNSYVEKYQSYFDNATEEFSDVSKGNLLEKIRTDVRKEKEERDYAKRQAIEQRKLARHEADLKRLAELQEERDIRKRLEKDKMESLNVNDRPKALVEEYHNLVQTKCYNFMIEIQIVKGLYTKYNLQPDVAHKVIKYMAKMGYKLVNLNYKIDEAMEFVEICKQRNEPDTIPYLIGYFYNKIGLKPSFKSFMKEYNCIKSSMLANNLTIEQVKNVLNGMIKEKVQVLLWFDSKVAKYANQAKKNDDPVHNYSEEREINENIQEIVNGKLTVDKVNTEIRPKCIAILKQKFMNGDFNENYNYFEWAFKINLPMDDEMIAYGEVYNNRRNSRFNKLGKQIIGDEAKANKYREVMNKYHNWLADYGLY